MKWYTTRDAANLLGLTPRWVRDFARSGILEPERGPRSEYRFSFQDLVLLRTAAGLRAARVPPRRVNEALDRLRRELPRGRSLTELRILAEDDRVVVHDGDAAWNPISGQYHLDFTIAELGERVAFLAPRSAVTAFGDDGVDRSASHWYEVGLELEAMSAAEARIAYERTLRLEPGHADAHVNLGRLLHHAGEMPAAETHFRAALDAGPNATAAFDLGIVLEDMGRPDEAVAAYQRAVEVDPDLADAHYNLARLLEGRGEAQAAIRHLAACKRITESRGRGRSK
ncbi:MAG TPA: tetratricopeptide repeat protein [Longimicrobiaceae bacterium]|nr:tetratricopeptide repeat protein [Longimicrobiaceae bacterium]